MSEYDVVIIGTGISGLYTALKLNTKLKILLITKEENPLESNTYYAQGGIAVPMNNIDSPEAHFKDTVKAGYNISNKEAVKILVTEAEARIRDLISLGVKFDCKNGKFHFTKEGGHSVPRILHAHGDATGEVVESVLLQSVKKRENISLLTNYTAKQIVIKEDRVTGLKIINNETNTEEEIRCKNIIIATGGAGQVYKYTTNSRVATGDGVALAFECGAEIMDMEFIQFHPTAFYSEEGNAFLITEAVRGEGGILRDVNGYRFMPEYHEKGELASRDIVARSIIFQMKKTSSSFVYIDITHLKKETILERFPHIVKYCKEKGIDVFKDYIPVVPVAHYMIGGIRTGLMGETTIKGLFACGETACTGVHGANRLASNSLIESLVFGKRVADAVENNINPIPIAEDVLLIPIEKKDVINNIAEKIKAIKELMWDSAGIIRNERKLKNALEKIISIGIPQEDNKKLIELKNLLLVSRLIITASLKRKESRGVHYREDYPKMLKEWEKHIIFRREI